MDIYRLIQVQVRDPARVVFTIECRIEGQYEKGAITMIGIDNDEGRISITSNTTLDLIGLAGCLRAAPSLWKSSQLAKDTWTDEELKIPMVNQRVKETQAFLYETIRKTIVEHGHHQKQIPEVSEALERSELGVNKLIEAIAKEGNNDTDSDS